MKKKEIEGIISNLNEAVKNKDFDLIDYYSICDVNPKEITGFLLKKDMVKREDLFYLYKKLSTFKSDDDLKKHHYDEITYTKVVDGELIKLNKDDNYKALSFIEGSSLPKTVKVYNAALLRLAKSKREEKAKVKKLV